jgi:hypothetical protein
MRGGRRESPFTTSWLDTHAPFEALDNVVDGSRSVLKRFQKNVVNRYVDPMVSPSIAFRLARHFLSDHLIVQTFL